MKMILFLSLLLTGCSGKYQTFKELVKKGKCEQAALDLPGFQRLKVRPDLSEYPAAQRSYILTKNVEGNDLVYLFIEGSIMPVVACTPVTVLESGEDPLVLKVPRSNNERCFSRVHELSSFYPLLGRKLDVAAQVFEKTEDWKCPHVDYEVEALRKVASCYDRAGKTEIAREQLLHLLDPKAFGTCVPKSQQEELRGDLMRIEKKLRRLRPRL